jgi:tRNA dimethylallyltransferase
LGIYSLNENKLGVFSPLYSPLYKKNKKKKKRVIVICGPTGVGKTSISISIAKILGGEVISSDSMQIYKGMDIGTNKVTKENKNAIKHHLIDVRSINETFNVVDFYNEAHKECRKLFSSQKVPIVVGGSGFYIHAFLYGPPLGPPADNTIREYLIKQIKSMGIEVLYERLQMLDPTYAKTVNEKDEHKIIRALEIICITKKTVSSIPTVKATKEVAYDYRCWFLHMPRDILYKKIDLRCEEMIEKGFIEEVKELDKKGLRNNKIASKSIGYRQCLDFLLTDQSEKEKEKFLNEFKKASRHYAKRQFTYFRKEPFFRWLDIEEIGLERTMEYILQDYEQGI